MELVQGTRASRHRSCLSRTLALTLLIFANTPSGRPLTAQPPRLLRLPSPQVRTTGRVALASHEVAQSTSNLAGSFSFNFRNAPWGLVLRNFAQQLGFSLHMKSEPSGTLTYFDDNVYHFTDAIDILNDYLIPEGSILIWNENKLTVATLDAAIPDGLVPYVNINDIAYLGRNTLATATVPVRGITPDEAAAEFQELLSPFGNVKALKNSSRIIVTDIGANLRRVTNLLSSSGLTGNAEKSHVYQLRNAPAEEVAIAINHFLLARNGQTFAPNDQNIQIVIPEKVTNSLLIHGTANEIAEIQALINRLDRTPSQVVIQALLVEVQLGNTDELGVEVGIQDSVLFDRGVIDNIVSTVTETIQNGDNKTVRQNVISQRSTPGFNFNNQPLGNNTAGNSSTVGGQGLSNFGVGRVNGDLGFGGLVLSAGSESISVLIRALSARFKTDVLSRPQIRTLDNHEALIQIGQQVPIVDGVAITAVGSANPVIRQDKAGIILRVTPRIAADGKVMINVNAEKSAFQLAPGSGVPIFTDATNGNVIESPVKDVTTATTSVSVQTGQTIVLGGMITRDMTTVERKVPVLGDIPILGRAFRFDLEQTSRKELLIFLTPHIVGSNIDDQQLNADEISRMCFPHQQAAELYGDFSGTVPLAVPATVTEETTPPGPRSIQTTDGDEIAVPPFGGETEQQPTTSTRHGWKPFPNWSRGGVPLTGPLDLAPPEPTSQ